MKLSASWAPHSITGHAAAAARGEGHDLATLRTVVGRRVIIGAVELFATADARVGVGKDLKSFQRNRLTTHLADAALIPVFLVFARDVDLQADPLAIAARHFSCTAAEEFDDQIRVRSLFATKHAERRQPLDHLQMVADPMPMAVWARDFEAFHGQFCSFAARGRQDSGLAGESPAQHRYQPTTALGGEIRIITAGQIGHNLGSLISRVRRKVER